MKMKWLDLKNCACFGVAGNFTGHLEQAGEATDFKDVKTLEKNAPKALFPTYIPNLKKNCGIPEFLEVFPFDSKKIVFPENEQKIQIEPECAVVFSAEWNDGKIVSIKPVCFAASNDVSIRKAGAKKISLKKNWGKSSKGISENLIPLDSFDEKSVLNNYRIASFMVRGENIFEYGENSAVRDYSYIYEKLESWLIEKINFQKDEGPAENVNFYLNQAGFPEKIMVSIGATRYTDFGERNFLLKGDRSVVALYPGEKYSAEEIKNLVQKNDFSDSRISVLSQEVVL